METELTFMEKVATIQNQLKAPKDKAAYNYSYRNAEEILGKVKPLLAEHGLAITLDDEILSIGEPCRWFIKSKAMITDGVDVISGTGIAELLTPAIGSSSGKASMNESQASGATSSYARKYALGAVLGIDDGDDADDAKYQPAVINSQKPARPTPAKPRADYYEVSPPEQIKKEHLSGAIKDTNIDPEVFKQLCFLPGKGRGNLNLDKETAKAVWDDCWQQGWRRGKFDMNTKTWTGTQIPMSAVPTIVGMFCAEAGLTEDATKAKISTILASAPYIPEAENEAAAQLPIGEDLTDYSDEPF